MFHYGSLLSFRRLTQNTALIVIIVLTFKKLLLRYQGPELVLFFWGGGGNCLNGRNQCFELHQKKICDCEKNFWYFIVVSATVLDEVL